MWSKKGRIGHFTTRRFNVGLEKIQSKISPPTFFIRNVLDLVVSGECPNFAVLK